MVPITCDYFMIDLIRDLDAPALLVSPGTLGSINDTLLSQMALQRKKIEYFWYINLYENREDFFTITAPFYKECYKKVPIDLDVEFKKFLEKYRKCK